MEPDVETRKRFNKLFEKAMEGQAGDIESIESAFEEAKKCLGVRNKEIQKPWISEHTFELIEQKHEMEQRCDPVVKNWIK